MKLPSLWERRKANSLTKFLKEKRTEDIGGDDVEKQTERVADTSVDSIETTEDARNTSPGIIMPEKGIIPASAISIEELENLTPEEAKEFLKFFSTIKDVMNKFYLPFEEEQLLIDSVAYRRKNSKSLGDVVILSGPSGAGKDTVIQTLLEANPHIKKLIAVTTRPKRGTEEDGVDYHFLTREQFLLLLEARLFADKAEFVGNFYAMPKIELRKRIGSDALVINAMPATSRIIKKLIPEAKTIVIMPPTETDQYDRLKHRGTESEDKIIARIEADKEMFKDYKSMFDYTIISENGNVQGAVDQMDKIIKDEKR